MPLPWMHLESRLDDFPFRGVHHEWDFGHFGLARQQQRKRVIADTPSIMPSSMQMSMTFAPFSTLLPGNADRLPRASPLSHQFRELWRAGDIRSFADHDVDAGLLREGLRS